MKFKGLDFSFPALLLSALVMPVALTILGFCFGITLDGGVLYFGMGVAFVLAGLHSIKRAVLITITFALAIFASFAVASYTSWDAAVCHWAQAQAMVEGWNPILNATKADLAAIVGEASCSFDHILCAPKFASIVSALASDAFGVFSGMMFLNVILFVALGSVVYDFLRSELKSGLGISIMAALLIAAPLELMRQTIQGYVDYCRYATFLIGAFSYFNWRRTRSYSNLMLFLVGFIVAAATKSAALPWALVVFLITGIIHRKEIDFRRGLLMASVLFVVLVLSPMIANWRCNGSPFYPAHSFDKSQPRVSLTGDLKSPLTRNADALKMKWIAREVYAWISPDLAIFGSKLWHGRQDFNPVFKVPFVNGLGSKFTYWLWFVLISLFFIKNRAVRLICVFIFATILIVPTKYVGFYRYTPEIAMLPPLCLAALTDKWRWTKYVAGGVLTYMALYLAVYGASWFDWQAGMEKARHARFKFYASRTTDYRIGEDYKPKLQLVYHRKMEQYGLRPVETDSAASICFAPPATFDLGIIPGPTNKDSRYLMRKVMDRKPVYLSYYNSLLTPFIEMNRWKAYDWGEIK